MPDEQPTTATKKAEDLDAEFLQAQIDLEAIKQQTIAKLIERDTAEDAQARRQDRLLRWVKAGFEDAPLPDSLEGAPLDVVMRLQAADPALARELGAPVPLPAGTELRLQQGVAALVPSDVEHLERAGHHEVIAQLRQRHEASLWEQFEAGQAAAAGQQEQVEQEWAERQAASEAEHNARMRAQFASRARAGVA
jgi:hypothetical protein